MIVELVRRKHWYWRVVSPNGQVVLTSEVYYSRWNAKRQALKLVKANNFEYREVSPK